MGIMGIKAKASADIKTLAVPISIIQKKGLTHSQLYRLRRAVGSQPKVGITDTGLFLLFSGDVSTWRKLTGILPFLEVFQEQRIDPIRIRVENIEIIDRDDPLFA